MLQRIISSAIPTYRNPRAWRNASRIGGLFGALMFAGLLVPPASVHAQTTVNYNFEDGVMRGSATSMKVPPKILTENGNKFMRITGSSGDCQSIPSSLCPPKNRSTVRFTTSFNNMPVISSSNMRQTYSARIRFHDNTGSDGTVFELFQAQEGGPDGGYGTSDGQGPVVRMQRRDGKVYFMSLYANETKVTQVSRTVPAGSWHTYKVVAVWSHDSAVGRLEYFLDDTKVMTVSGRDVNLGPKSNRLPEMKLGLYGDNAVGKIDVDNVKAGPSSSSLSAPSVALSAPTNVLLVSGQ
jgi:hypothetical protein